jgi:hypothetical protein
VTSLSWRRILGALLVFLCFDLAALPSNAREISVQLSKGLLLTATVRPFVANAHKLQYCEDEVLCLVDGYAVFGTESAIPRTELTNLTLHTSTHAVRLEHRGMFNPWSPIEGEDLHVVVVGDSLGYRIRGRFSDGAATYVAEWLVIKNRSVRVLIDYVECAAMTCASEFRKE